MSEVNVNFHGSSIEFDLEPGDRSDPSCLAQTCPFVGKELSVEYGKDHSVFVSGPWHTVGVEEGLYGMAQILYDQRTGHCNSERWQRVCRGYSKVFGNYILPY